MPSTPGAPLLALTRPSARPRFSRESSRSHNETSRPGRTASPECADRPLRSTAVLNGTSTSPPGSRPACAGCLRLLRPARAAPTPPPHPAFGPSRLMSVPPPVLRPLLTSARSTPTSRCEPSARRHHSTTDTRADLPGQERSISPCARRVYVTTLLMVTGFTFLSRLTQIAQPHTRFVFLGAGFRLGLPSHPASRRRSCLRLGVSTTCAPTQGRVISPHRESARRGRTRSPHQRPGRQRPPSRARTPGRPAAPRPAICRSQPASPRAGVSAGSCLDARADTCGVLSSGAAAP